MYDQIFEAYRKASESWLQVHQDFFKQGASNWLTATPTAAGAASDWGRSVQRRLLELSIEMLHRHRETIDTVYRSAIHLLEQASRMAEAKSPDEYRRLVEGLWRDWFESVKTQSESQFRDVQNWAGKSLEIVKSAQA